MLSESWNLLNAIHVPFNICLGHVDKTHELDIKCTCMAAFLAKPKGSKELAAHVYGRRRKTFVHARI